MDVHCDGVARLRQATGETLRAQDWNPNRMAVRGSHDYHKEINARLERLKLRVQSEFREMLDREQVPYGDDLRRILRPLRKQKLEGQAQTAPEILLAFAEKYKER